jgi:quinoprotein glucose dehydrogenase
LSVQGLPLLKPPYGRITAISLVKGDIVWQIAHGETPDYIRHHPALKGLNIPRTGRPGILGTLTTKTLVIAGESGFFTTASGARGAILRADDNSGADERIARTYPCVDQRQEPTRRIQDAFAGTAVQISRNPG